MESNWVHLLEYCFHSSNFSYMTCCSKQSSLKRFVRIQNDHLWAIDRKWSTSCTQNSWYRRYKILSWVLWYWFIILADLLLVVWKGFISGVSTGNHADLCRLLTISIVRVDGTRHGTKRLWRLPWSPDHGPTMRAPSVSTNTAVTFPGEQMKLPSLRTCKVPLTNENHISHNPLLSSWFYFI